MKTKRDIIESLDTQKNTEAASLKEKLNSEPIQTKPSETIFSINQHESNLSLASENFNILEPIDSEHIGPHTLEKARFHKGEIQVLVRNSNNDKTWIDIHDTHEGINLAIRVLSDDIKIPVKGTPSGCRVKRIRPKKIKRTNLMNESCSSLK